MQYVLILLQVSAHKFSGEPRSSIFFHKREKLKHNGKRKSDAFTYASGFHQAKKKWFKMYRKKRNF